MLGKIFVGTLPLVGLLFTACVGMPGGRICWFGECPRIPLNEEACTTANWEQVGEQDGSEGYGYLAEAHDKNCAKYKKARKVRRAAYQKGWTLGNQRYCTPENAYRVGLRGESYDGVCPANQEAAFIRNFNAGTRIHNIREKYNRLLEKQESLVRERGNEEQKLATATDDWSRRRALEAIREVDLKLHRVAHQIRLFEMKHVDVLAE